MVGRAVVNWKMYKIANQSNNSKLDYRSRLVISLLKLSVHTDNIGPVISPEWTLRKPKDSRRKFAGIVKTTQLISAKYFEASDILVVLKLFILLKNSSNNIFIPANEYIVFGQRCVIAVMCLLLI